MIPYMDLNEQVDADFTRARRRARLRAVAARIRREHTSNRLLSFDDVRRELAANNRRPRGTRVVEVNEIVGSVGRWRRSEEHTSELQSRQYLVCRLLLEKKKNLN